jgi:(S)-sulfolactate dehydrogenase
MTDIIISEFIDAPTLEALQSEFKVHYDPDLVSKPEELARLGAEVPAIIVRNRTQMKGAVLAACKKLGCIGRIGVGLDNIDVVECERRGIKVFPATGANAVSVAEWTIAAILMGLRDVWQAKADVLGGKWPRTAMMKGEAAGRTLGIVGFGDIGRKVARRAAAFDLRVIATDPYVQANDPTWREFGVERVTFERLLVDADIVSLHAPLTDETRNIIDATALRRMKNSALLVNSARGGMIDEAALATALKGGEIAGAVIDVFDEEPFPAGSILTGVPNLWLTPHIAGVTNESNARVCQVTGENVRRFLKGKR